MRVALDGLPLSRPLTGVGHYTLELARHLALNNRQDEVSVVTPRAFVPTVRFQTARAELKLIRPTVVPIIRYWWKFALPAYLRRNRIELFHGTNFELPSQTHCATVLTIHDLSTLLYAETHESRNVARAKSRLPGAAARASMIVCPTEAVREEIKEYLRIPLDRVVAIPEAARDSLRRLESSEVAPILEHFGIGKEFLLYVGTVEPRKNLLSLVKAFELVSHGRESIQLVIAGKKGWMVEDLFAYVKRSDVRRRIIFTGYVSDTDLCALYSACSVFVYPSHYEGFGLPPLEAMSCGAPVIASRIPSISEVVGSAARLVSPADPEEMAAAILEVVGDAELRQRMALAGAKRVAEFSWARTAAKVREVYQEALERHGRKEKG